MLFQILLALAALCTVTANGYASNSAQFDPSGRILKTEFAKRAVTDHGGPVLAIRCKDGIILSAARRIRRSNLILSHPKKVFLVDRHVCIGATGSLSQAQALIQAAKSVCSQHRDVFAAPIPVERLCDALSDEMHRLTREGQSNPCGVSLLIAGWDHERGPQVRSFGTSTTAPLIPFESVIDIYS
jgi:20S proteasome alpha/beta subunit